MLDLLEKDSPEIRTDNRFCDTELKNLPLAMAYVPMQRFNDLYENKYDALKNGTLFKELDKPFKGKFVG